jgi:transcription elongation GreA/GreB family factor
VSVLEIKQSLSRLSARERKEVLIYLQQLRRATPAWRKATAKRIRDAQAGKVTTIDELEARFRRGKSLRLSSRFL